MSNRERSQRALLPAEVAVETAGSQVFRTAVNLSPSGILLAADELPEVGTTVRVVISLPPTGRFVRLQGRVVRHEQATAYAVAFEAIEERERLALEDYTANA